MSLHNLAGQNLLNKFGYSLTGNVHGVSINHFLQGRLTITMSSIVETLSQLHSSLVRWLIDSFIEFVNQLFIIMIAALNTSRKGFKSIFCRILNFSSIHTQAIVFLSTQAKKFGQLD